MLDLKLFRPWLKKQDVISEHNRRGESRIPVIVSAELIVGLKAFSCRIVDLASQGCRLKIDCNQQLELCIGELAILRLPNGTSLSGVLRWIQGDDLGIQLCEALDVHSIIEQNEMRRNIPRAGRTPVSLSIKVLSGKSTFDAKLKNISATGALISCNAEFLCDSTVFLHSEMVRPIGGYVRWRKNKDIGVMFNRLLPIKTAEFFSELHGVNEFWIHEVKQMHLLNNKFQNECAA